MDENSTGSIPDNASSVGEEVVVNSEPEDKPDEVVLTANGQKFLLQTRPWVRFLSIMVYIFAVFALLGESDFDEDVLESEEVDSVLLLSLLALRFDGPEYRSDSQPPPFKMKPPPPIIRRALSLPHFGHFLSGLSVMRCTRSNSWPQASQA
jgi:hypothetical protein